MPERSAETARGPPASTPSERSNPPAFFAGGEMAARMREHDWSASPLGPPEGWPPSLRSALLICLNMPIVSAVHWGPDLRILYNDAYAPALAERHPWALGQPFRDVWAEIWDVLGPQIDSVVATGRGFSTERQLLRMNRRGRVDDTWWVYSFAPLYADDGAVGGIFVTAIDETDKVMAEHRLTQQRDRQRQLFEQAPGFIAVLSGPDLSFDFVNAAYERVAGRRGFVGQTVREMFPDLEGQPFFDLLDNAYATGERFVAQAIPIRLQATPEAEPADRFLDFIYEPVRDEAGAVTGIFIEGHDVTEAHVAQQALRDGEIRFRALVNASSDVVYRMSPDWTEMRRLAGRGFLADTEQPSIKWLDAYIFPEDRPHILAAIDAAVQAKGVFELEHRVQQADGASGWTFSRAVPVADAQGEIVEWFGMASDVTDRVVEQRSRDALNRLGALMDSGGDVGDLSYAAGRVLGAALGASRVGYGTIDASTDTLYVERDWTADGVESLRGATPLRHYGSFIDSLKLGEFISIGDVRLDPRTAAAASALEARSARAFVNMPVLEGGRLVAVLFVNSDRPRHWSAGEQALVRVVAERTRTAVERARSAAALVASEAHLKLMVLELNHRVKNNLAIVQSIASQTLRADQPAAGRDAFLKRIQALAVAHDILTREQWEGLGIREIAHGVLDVLDGAARRVTMTGPPLRITPKAGLALAMALHELGTNALKYGALSAPDGRVDLDWTLTRPDVGEMVIRWSERDGPPVEPPTRRGFGSRLLERGLAADFEGRITLDYAPSGVVCTIEGVMRDAAAAEPYPVSSLHP